MTLSSGPLPSEIMLISDAPSWLDISKNTAFASVGQALNPAMRALGVIQNSCFLTYLFPRRFTDEEVEKGTKPFLAERKTCPGPGWVWENGFWLSPELLGYKQELLKTIAEVRPKLIIALGPLTLWALAGVKELDKWRGSRLQPPGLPCPVLPTYDLARPIAQPESLGIILMDFKRAKGIYEGTQNPRAYKFTIKPTFPEVFSTLDKLYLQANRGPLLLSGDLETRLGHIACFGIAWSATEALCIPFLQIGKDNPYYWTEGEEAEIVYRL